MKTHLPSEEFPTAEGSHQIHLTRRSKRLRQSRMTSSDPPQGIMVQSQDAHWLFQRASDASVIARLCAHESGHLAHPAALTAADFLWQPVAPCHLVQDTKQAKVIAATIAFVVVSSSCLSTVSFHAFN